MTIAYWTVVLMTLYPYVFAGLFKSTKGFDHHKPRIYVATLSGWRQRAYWVHENSYEIFPFFIAAVFIAQQVAGATHQSSIDKTCVFFVVSRIAYAIAYLKDKAMLRSSLWTLGFFAILYLYGIAAFA
ncbi:MAG: hypothetical protein RLZ35_200 [Pseudomonadota bacterium]|jgi:uncharacterized MAPEG superfamily protein